MKLILLFGPSAVGKMTVGRELAKQTSLKLFYNHLSIELVLHFFDFDEPGFSRLDKLIRFGVFEEVAKSDLSGLIFTFCWAFDQPADEAYVDRIVRIFEKEGAEVFYVELAADQKVRLARNRHEDRLLHKPSKRDLKRSEKVLLYHDENHRFNSAKGEFQRPNYVRIDNTNLSPEEVTSQIVEAFSF